MFCVIVYTISASCVYGLLFGLILRLLLGCCVFADLVCFLFARVWVVYVSCVPVEWVFELWVAVLLFVAFALTCFVGCLFLDIWLLLWF